MNKSNNRVILFVIVLFSLLALLVTLVFVKLLKYNKTGVSFNEVYSTVKVVDEEYEDNFKYIDIDTEVADVIVGVSNDEKTHVVIYNPEELTDYNKTDDSIKASLRSQKCFLFCTNQEHGKVEILLPENYSEKIEIKSAVGDVNVEDFNLANVTVNSNVGDVHIESGKHINVRTDVGDIKIDNVYEYLKLKSNIGDIKIKNLNITKNSSIDSEVGDVEITRINDIFIDASSSVGDTDIRENNRKSDITLRITTSVGDIEVG